MTQSHRSSCNSNKAKLPTAWVVLEAAATSEETIETIWQHLLKKQFIFLLFTFPSKCCNFHSLCQSVTCSVTNTYRQTNVWLQHGVETTARCGVAQPECVTIKYGTNFNGFNNVHICPFNLYWFLWKFKFLLLNNLRERFVGGNYSFVILFSWFFYVLSNNANWRCNIKFEIINGVTFVCIYHVCIWFW